MKTLPYP